MAQCFQLMESEQVVICINKHFYIFCILQYFGILKRMLPRETAHSWASQFLEIPKGIFHMQTN